MGTTATPPTAPAALLELIGASWTSQAICVAAELRIADLLASGAQTVDELACATQCHNSSLQRLLRALASLNLCAEQDDGSFALTPFGALLGSDAHPSLRSWAIWWGRQQWTAWGSLLYSVRTGASARGLLTGSHGYGHLDRDAESAAVFNRAMLELTRLVADEVVRVYDFATTRRLVDIGGGYGELLIAILRAFPRVRGVLFDLPHAAEGARAHAKEAGVAERCEVVTGDFFDKVPGDADTYLLKSVLHNWDDGKCAAILRNCRRAMATGTCLVLVERVMPSRMTQSSTDRAVARADLNMLIGPGGRERTQLEFTALLAAQGFDVEEVRQTATDFSVIAATAA